MKAQKMRAKLHIRRGDTVEIVTGRDKGERGRVLETYPAKGRVVVEGRNLVWKHLKAGRQHQRSGRIEMEAPLNASNVMLLCQNRECERFDSPVRTRKAVGDDGVKRRVCIKCGHSIEPQQQEQ